MTEKAWIDGCVQMSRDCPEPLPRAAIVAEGERARSEEARLLKENAELRSVLAGMSAEVASALTTSHAKHAGLLGPYDCTAPRCMRLAHLIRWSETLP
jgi:hypothetical protein